ncbi:EP1-like glycoprotein 4 [Hevea brasiliensis]|uniref:EP1-like glycoprotein 4 n=1 Tax=Hevea brasiliensis TaxID=3981 RepID=UPI0025EA6DEB|nr:EP1-like glycoprotein 4 [Hevea brasiliensis]
MQRGCYIFLVVALLTYDFSYSYSLANLLVDGNSELRDTDGSLVWSTKTSKKSVAGMKMMDTRNFVLHDSNNNIVWQSFDHPTDTLLPGQKLVRGQKLVSSVSKDNISDGNFYLSMTSHGLFGFYDAEVSQMYFKYLDYGGNMESIELKYNGLPSIIKQL